MTITNSSAAGIWIDSVSASSTGTFNTTKTTSLAIGGGTKVIGGAVGLLVDSGLSLVGGDALNDTTFSGQSGSYVRLSNGALSGTQLDATGVNFDGVNGASATAQQIAAIEAKIFDRHNDPQLGLVVVRSPSLPAPIVAAPPVVAVVADGTDHVELLNPDGTVRLSLWAFDQQFDGPISVAAGDVNGDGVPDLIVGAGAGADPHVEVFDGSTGALILSFDAFAPAFRGGVTVAAGDLNGDGHADLIVGAGVGGQSHVEAFCGADGSLLASFLAFPGYVGPVTVAAGDVNGDGHADVIVGAGPGGQSHVEVFSGADMSVLRSFFAFGSGYQGQVAVTAGDFSGTGRVDLAVAGFNGSSTAVGIFNGADSSMLASYPISGQGTLNGPASVASARPNGASHDELVFGSGAGSVPLVHLLDGLTGEQLATFLAFDQRFMGGVNV